MNEKENIDGIFLISKAGAFHLKRRRRSLRRAGGVFIIDGDKIQYERWTSSTGGGMHTLQCFGYIENDTTFHITEAYYSNSREMRQVNEIYRFKQFSPKPDSTNVYIK